MTSPSYHPGQDKVESIWGQAFDPSYFRGAATILPRIAVIAEGVKFTDQPSSSGATGCDLMQGYMIEAQIPPESSARSALPGEVPAVEEA